MKVKIGRKTSTYTHKQRGMSLLEVLVSMLVIGIGLAMTISMLMASARYGNSAGNRSVAMSEMQSIIDSMRANALGTNGYLQGNTGSVQASSICGTSCSSEKDKFKHDAQNLAYQRAFAEVRAWQARLADRLPNGEGNIVAVPNSNSYRVHIQWSRIEENQQADTCTNGGGKTCGTDEMNLVFTL